MRSSRCSDTPQFAAQLTIWAVEGTLLCCWTYHLGFTMQYCARCWTYNWAVLCSWTYNLGCAVQYISFRFLLSDNSLLVFLSNASIDFDMLRITIEASFK